MASDHDREHFEDYREQTQVKHEILAAYLPAYFHILKSGSKNLLFIDGFAGRGTYTKAGTGEQVDGSPLRALKLVADNAALADKVSTIFIESDNALFEQLDSAVADFYRCNPHIREPVCLLGTFADQVGEVLKAVKGRLAPTFLFVDPCGVSGASFATICDVMKCDKCEAFIFFNLDGVRRIAGLDKVSQTLVDLLGSEKRAQALYDALRKTGDVYQREQLILSHYREAISQDIGARFIIPFRVEHEDKQKTSHYLIHATKHNLGFKIMKDVMWRRGHAEHGGGGLALAQASRTNYIPLFDPGAPIEESIIGALASGSLKVDVFCNDWVIRPEDVQCETSYKEAIKKLEAKGLVEVLSKDGKNVVPATARPKRNGKTTLANDYYVRLAKKKRLHS